MFAITAKESGLFLSDPPGGTSKMFLISLILAKIIFRGNIALAIASSGIAGTLLNDEKISYSALKLLLNIQTNENEVNNIKKHTVMAKILQQCYIIV